MSYPGGKNGPGVYQFLINQIPAHRVYVSATAGHDAVLQHKRPADRNIAIDPDERVCQWWADRREDVELWQCNCIDWLRINYGLMRFPSCRSTGACLCGEALPVPAVSSKSGGGSRAARKGGTGSRCRCFVLIDPPYPGDLRTSGRVYRHEAMNWDWHEELIGVIALVPAMVMICCYPNDRYDKLLAGWRTADYWATARSGERRRERIWMNYGKPERLHDSRFLGGDKRSREKYRRRSRNLLAKINRLPPDERQALLDSIEQA